MDSRHGNGIARIDRITKTQIITRSSKYRRSDGSLIGASTYEYEFVKILTTERKVKVITSRLRNKAKKMINNVEIPTDISKIEELIVAIKPFVREDV